jgi:hypothetical protein
VGCGCKRRKFGTTGHRVMLIWLHFVIAVELFVCFFVVVVVVVVVVFVYIATMADA